MKEPIIAQFRLPITEKETVQELMQKGVDWGKTIGAIEELEKIKAEIEDMWIKSAKDLKTGEVIYENLCEHSEVLEILENHISELKGEQKIEKVDCGKTDCNNCINHNYCDYE
jgi:Icc-related predicted phosphoesterase